MGKNPAISRNASAAAYWDEIRRSFDAAAAVAEAAAEPAGPDAAAIELSDWADNRERYSKPHVIEKKKSARAASNASW